MFMRFLLSSDKYCTPGVGPGNECCVFGVYEIETEREGEVNVVFLECVRQREREK